MTTLSRRNLIRPKQPSLPLALALFAWLASAPAAPAATYRIPTDDLLVGKAGVIVRGEVTRIESLKDKDGAIRTEITLSVSRVLKGSRIPGTLTVRQPGGTVGGESFIVPGIGTFTPHEEVLLFLDATAGGSYRLTDFALGKFHVGRAADGSEFLRRDGLYDAHVLGPSSAAGAGAAESMGGAIIDPDRDAAGFERFITDMDSGLSPRDDYRLPSLQVETGASVDFIFFDPNHPARYNQFDTGGTVTYKDNSTGDPNCSNGCHAEVAAGIMDWNATPGAVITIAYGGTDATIGSKGFAQLVNQIQFNDPGNEITDLSGCSGTLALGGLASTSLGGTSVVCATDPGGPVTVAYDKITNAGILVNNGVGGCINSCDYENMIAHETGHTIGAGHTNTMGALMFPNLTGGRCGVLQPDDIAFAQCLYPQALLACNASASPTVGRHPLSVSFNPGRLGGVAPFTFDWQFGDGGSDTAERPTHVYQGPGTFPAQVSVTDANSQVCTDSIDIQVLPCLPPVVTSALPRFRYGHLRARVFGSGFQRHATVQIDAGSGFVSAPRTVFKRRTNVVGFEVESIWPAGVPVMIRVLSPTGCPSNAVAAMRP